MKKLFLFTTLILAHFEGYSQTYKSIDKLHYRCEYKLVYQPDSSDKKSQKTENMLLLIGDSSSVFYSKNEYLKDSIYIANKIWTLAPNDKIAIAGNIPKVTFKYKIIKNQNSQKTIFNERILIDNFQYEDSLNQFNWEILDSTKLILGYQCQKATTTFAGRKYTVWFSNELPINDGPYKFSGLPGLIITLTDTKNHYSFQMVGFKTTQDENIYIPKTKAFIVSRKVFEKKRFENENNPFKALTQNNSTMAFSAGGNEMSAQQMDKLVQAELKKNNNPIELK